MENASKALIIAGSILVTIVIVSLGVMIVNNVTETIQSNSNLSEQEIATYNQPFLAYEGTQKGSQAVALVNKVISHNNANRDDNSKQITVELLSAAPAAGALNFSAPTAADAYTTIATTNATVKNGLRSGYTYKVYLYTDAQSGLITKIGLDQL